MWAAGQRVRAGGEGACQVGVGPIRSRGVGGERAWHVCGRGTRGSILLVSPRTCSIAMIRSATTVRSCAMRSLSTGVSRNIWLTDPRSSCTSVESEFSRLFDGDAATAAHNASPLDDVHAAGVRFGGGSAACRRSPWISSTPSVRTEVEQDTSGVAFMLRSQDTWPSWGSERDGIPSSEPSDSTDASWRVG